MDDWDVERPAMCVCCMTGVQEESGFCWRCERDGCEEALNRYYEEKAKEDGK